jgi:DNA-binding MarR family transcriptional regulator
MSTEQRCNRRGKPMKELSALSKECRDALNYPGEFMIVSYAMYELMVRHPVTAGRHPDHATTAGDRDDAQVLSYLWNKRIALELSDAIQPGGWFYCTQKQIQTHLGIEPSTQYRIFARLTKRGLIQTKQRGRPAKRYVRVHRRRLLDELKKINNLRCGLPEDWQPANLDGDWGENEP